MRQWCWILACAQLAVGPPALASEPAPPLLAELAGHTLSAVAYVMSPPGGDGRAPTLQRIMLQAYLAADGTTLVREWSAGRNTYTALAHTRWSLSGDRLCLDLPNRPLCANVHVWAPRIAGTGTQPYAMLNGDLHPGNIITRMR